MLFDAKPWLHERVDDVAPDELASRFAAPAAQEAMAYVQRTLREELARRANKAEPRLRLANWT